MTYIPKTKENPFGIERRVGWKPFPIERRKVISTIHALRPKPCEDPSPYPFNQVVEVEWLDSASIGGWRNNRNIDDITKLTPLICRSAGYLVRYDAECLVLVQNTHDDGGAGDAIAIPSFAITEIKLMTFERFLPFIVKEVSPPMKSSKKSGKGKKC